jgi:hypothetical protein
MAFGNARFTRDPSISGAGAPPNDKDSSGSSTPASARSITIEGTLIDHERNTSPYVRRKILTLLQCQGPLP